MSILEQVSEMKNQGVLEEEIIKKLQDQGISPRVINDALNKTKIKKAITNEEGYSEYEIPPKPTPSPQGSIKAQEISDEETYYPQPQEEYSPQDSSQYQEEPGQTLGSNTDTIIEISEQVFSEKIQKIQKQVDEFSEFKVLEESKIKNLSERTKRMETMIDKLQTAILERIGSYGSKLDSVKKEMSMMQDSFSKVINPLAEKAEEKHHTHSQTTKTHTKRRTKKVKKR